MAEVEEVIAARLLAYPGLAALVGTRIDPVQRPQADLLPAITYRRTDDNYVQCFADSGSLQYPVIKINCWGRTYASTRAVARQVSNALAGWSNPNSTPVIQDVRPVNGSTDEDFDGDDVVVEALYFEVWHEES